MYTRIADILTAVYDKIDDSVIDLSQESQHFIVAPYFLKKDGGLMEVSSGRGIAQLLMVDDGGEARYVDDFDEDVVKIMDYLAKARVDWVKLTDGCAFTRDQLDANKGKERITNLISPAKRALKLRVIKSIENGFFDDPDASNDKTPWGLKYWIVKCSGATAGGYTNGSGLPAGFTDKMGLSVTTYPQLRNYADNYTAMTKEDLILKMKRAWRRTGWVSPFKQVGFKGDATNRRVLMTNEDALEAFETLAEGQNENLGNDLAPFHAGKVPGLTKIGDTGEVLFKRHPMVYARKLDSDTSDPVYGLDMQYFKCGAFKGSNMRTNPFVNLAAGKQHNIWSNSLDHKHQYFCFNPRSCFVISK
jgi:hypothetical protein